MSDTWKSSGQKAVYNIVDPLIRFFIKVGITPNMITSVGFVINLAVTIVFIIGAEYGERDDHQYVLWAGLLILFAGLMDMLDGRLARLGQMANKFGALYDSVLDRYSELFMFLGICYYLVSHDYFLSSIFTFLAMIGSIMVSYTRARAEGLGVTASVGLMQRPERILLLGISAIISGSASFLYNDFKIEVEGLPIPIFETISFFTFPIFLLAILANITAIRRLLYAKEVLNREEES